MIFSAEVIVMLKYKAAPMGGSISLVTYFVFMLVLAAFLGMILIKGLLFVVFLLTIIMFWTYFCWTPVEYGVDGGELTIFYRFGKKTFNTFGGPFKPDRLPKFCIKIWANGGLFAGAGLFWGTGIGLFRAYVTTTAVEKIIAFKDSRGVIFISPHEPDKIIEELR